MPHNNEQIQLLKDLWSLQKETQASILSLDKKLDLHIQSAEYELTKIKELDAEQNRILQEHHDRSIQLKKDNELRELELSHRIAKIEKPQKFLKSLNSILVYLFAIAGGLESIVKVWEFLKK